MKAHFAPLAAVLLAALSVAPSGSQTVAPAIRLSMLAGKPCVDGVFLNGHGPYRFLVDTGSQSNQLEAGLARKLGLASTSQVRLYTPSGSATVPAGTVSKVSLGPMDASDQEFLFTAFDGIHTQAADIQGILGQEFLTHFDYTLDIRHRRLMFSGEAPKGEKLDVRLIFGRMTVSTSIGDLVLDSGAEMLFLFRDSPRMATARVMAASGIAAPISFDAAPAVEIGGRIYHPDKAEFHKVPDAEEAGLLPVNLFDSIFISNSKRFVVLNPEMKSRR